MPASKDKKAAEWFKVRGHVGESGKRFKEDARQRKAAEDAPQSRILTKQQLQQGEWDASRVLMTTLNGELRPIGPSDLAAFRRNMELARKRFKGGDGITARQVIDLASSSPVRYNVPLSGIKSDIDKARREITRAIPVSAASGMLRFVTNAGDGSKVTRHHVTVVLHAFGEAGRKLASKEAKDRQTPKQVANWVRKQKLAFECDCERFRYFFRYVATIGGFAAGRQEWGYPKIRNPDLKGVACKHVLRVMTELEGSNTVLTFLTKHMEKLKLSEDNTAKHTLTEAEAKQVAAKNKTREIKTSSEIAAKRRQIAEGKAIKMAMASARRTSKQFEAKATLLARDIVKSAKGKNLTARQITEKILDVIKPKQQKIERSKPTQKERTAVKAVASKQNRTLKKTPSATRSLESALKTGKMSKAELDTLRKYGLSDAQIKARLNRIT